MPMETLEWLHATQRSFDHFLLRQINERMHWFLGNFTAHHLLDTDSQVARALAGLFHPWPTPGCTRAATRTCRCRRKKLPPLGRVTPALQRGFEAAAGRGPAGD